MVLPGKNKNTRSATSYNRLPQNMHDSEPFLELQLPDDWVLGSSGLDAFEAVSPKP